MGYWPPPPGQRELTASYEAYSFLDVLATTDHRTYTNILEIDLQTICRCGAYDVDVSLEMDGYAVLMHATKVRTLRFLHVYYLIDDDTVHVLHMNFAVTARTRRIDQITCRTMLRTLGSSD
jgi:hypothetical protein